MSAAAALARAEAAGVRFRLAPGGGVRMEAAAPPPPDVLADLRRWREDVARVLAERAASLSVAAEAGARTDSAPDPDEAAERAAMADHHAAAPADCPWRPGDRDSLRDGLLAGWRASRSGRLAAIALRLEAARPRWAWGVREMDWRAWQTAAQEAAALPSVEWSSWRAKVGTAATAWPQRGTTDRNSLAHPGDHDP